MSNSYEYQNGFHSEALEYVVLASEEAAYVTGVVLSAEAAENE